MITYMTKGVCSNKVTFELENNTLKSVKFYSGCSGNLQGISKLVEGMPADEVIKRLKGIMCKDKNTSCPDQLAKALENELNSEAR